MLGKINEGYVVIVCVRRPWWKLVGRHDVRRIHSRYDTWDEANYCRDSCWGEQQRDVFVAYMRDCTNEKPLGHLKVSNEPAP